MHDGDGSPGQGRKWHAFNNTLKRIAAWNSYYITYAQQANNNPALKLPELRVCNTPRPEHMLAYWEGGAAL